MKIAIILIVVIAAVSAAVFAFARSRNTQPVPPPRVGGIYSVNGDEAGNFAVIKVLRVDPRGVHVSMFKNKFRSRPTSVDESKLEFGTIHDPEPPGIMHMPLSNAAYTRLNPQFVQQSSVTPEELEPINKYWQDGGGYWP